MNQSEKRIYLIQELLKESDEYNRITIPQKTEDQKLLLRGLMNIRPPRRTNADFQKIQDSYLIEETMKKGIEKLEELAPIQPGIYVWQGDITTLQCDAIVNAANS